MYNKKEREKASMDWWESLTVDESISFLQKYKIHGHDLGCNAEDVLWIWEEENKPEPKIEESIIDIMSQFCQIYGSYGSISSFLGSAINAEDKRKNPYEDLNNGFNLRPIERKGKDGEPIENENKYSHLYRGDKLISTEIFRKGGIGGKFKDGYCELLHYKPESDPKKSSEGYTFGRWCIVNESGSIMFEQENSLDHPTLVGGRILQYKDFLIDLVTGKKIAPKGSSSIKGWNSLIIEHRYDWYAKELDFDMPIGIYKIDLQTAKVTKIDDIK